MRKNAEQKDIHEGLVMGLDVGHQSFIHAKSWQVFLVP